MKVSLYKHNNDYHKRNLLRVQVCRKRNKNKKMKQKEKEIRIIFIQRDLHQNLSRYNFSLFLTAPTEAPCMGSKYRGDPWCA